MRIALVSLLATGAVVKHTGRVTRTDIPGLPR
jgi:hypothetical protein